MGGLLWNSLNRDKISNAFDCSRNQQQTGATENNLIDENGNILIQHDETYPNLSQGFLLKAKRKRLRTLKDIAACNVAKYTAS
jgi:hypothetical protein